MDTQFASSWLKELVDKLGMKVLAGPMVENCEDENNYGISGAVLLTTSHSVIHIWPNDDIPRVEFDCYSCSDIDLEIIWGHMQCMEPIDIEYKFLDRAKGFRNIKQKQAVKLAA